MKVNVKRLLIDCLPVIMRQPRIYALLRVLCSQVSTLHEQLQSWRVESLRQASYTWQTASIERAVLEQMGTVITISIGDGQPYDFRVAVENPGEHYDDGRLRAIIDKYKPAGRRYVIEGSDVSYAVQFSDYVCEQVDVDYSVVFSDYVCELEELPRIDNYITLSVSPIREGTVAVTAIASFPVTSALIVYTDSGLEIRIREGYKQGTVEIDEDTDPGEIISVTPDKDDTYRYLY